MVTIINQFNGHCNMRQNEITEQQEMEAQWPELLGHLFDKLTGKGAIITYGFRNLEVEIPREAGQAGQNLGSAKWVLNGDLVIKAQSNSQTPGEIE